MEVEIKHRLSGASKNEGEFGLPVGKRSLFVADKVEEREFTVAPAMLYGYVAWMLSTREMRKEKMFHIKCFQRARRVKNHG